LALPDRRSERAIEEANHLVDVVRVLLVVVAHLPKIVDAGLHETHAHSPPGCGYCIHCKASRQNPQPRRGSTGGRCLPMLSAEPCTRTRISATHLRTRRRPCASSLSFALVRFELGWRQRGCRPRRLACWPSARSRTRLSPDTSASRSARSAACASA